MGTSRWDGATYASYSNTRLRGRSTEQIYTARGMKSELDPKGITMRESKDSLENPESNAIIIGLDVTGSMGIVLDAMVRGLGTLMEEIYDRKPVSDPHVMCMGIGDMMCDSAPLQVTQFEADIRIAEQLTDIWLERGGGGNNHESYILPWYFAATKTDIDCWNVRQKKGYLFTVGDECITPVLKKELVQKYLGYGPQEDLSAEDVYEMASQKYEIFHVMVAEGSYMRYGSRRDDAVRSWTNVLGQRALMLSDHTKLPQIVVSAIQMNEGMSTDEIAASWDEDSREAVENMINFQNGLRA